MYGDRKVGVLWSFNGAKLAWADERCIRYFKLCDKQNYRGHSEQVNFCIFGRKIVGIAFSGQQFIVINRIIYYNITHEGDIIIIVLRVAGVKVKIYTTAAVFDKVIFHFKFLMLCHCDVILFRKCII